MMYGRGTDLSNNRAQSLAAANWSMACRLAIASGSVRLKPRLTRCPSASRFGTGFTKFADQLITNASKIKPTGLDRGSPGLDEESAREERPQLSDSSTMLLRTFP